MISGATSKASTNLERLRRRLERQVAAAIVRYSVIEAGDKVMVCLSES